jgi:hypothetical protein
MRIRVQVVIEADQESAVPLHMEEVACFERGPLSPETFGLQLSEAKQMLVLSSLKNGRIERGSVSRKEPGHAEDFARESSTR